MQTQFGGIIPLIGKLQWRPGIIGSEGGFQSEKPFMPTWGLPIVDEVPQKEEENGLFGRFLNLWG